MYTLDNFYQSKQWTKLLQVLKLERVNDNGELICWHCGKPITKEYDAIGHHTIYLTEENVNNTEISLNPDLIQFVHHRCHNKIHDKLGWKRREIYLVYGSPMAGKSSYVAEASEPGDLILDIDSIWQCVSGMERYKKPARLNSVVFAVRDFLMDCMKRKLGKWQSAYLIGGYPLISERERICKQLGAREIFIDTSKEECLARLEACTDGRDKKEWQEYIETWWQRYRPNKTPQ